MRELVVCTFLTLDGVMQAPGAPDEDPEGGFTLGGWQASYLDVVTNSAIAAFMDKPFDLTTFLAVLEMARKSDLDSEIKTCA